MILGGIGVIEDAPLALPGQKRSGFLVIPIGYEMLFHHGLKR
jgi:hypothetical protein